jgi:hypothetical protein
MKKELADLTFACCDCGGEWTLTASEQDFFDSRDLAWPKRCKPCRVAKRAKYAALEAERGR